MNMFKIFTPSEASIITDVMVFLNKEFPKMKNPGVWKVDLYNDLSHMEIPVTVEQQKADEVAKFSTICGKAMAKIVLNNLPDNYELDREIITDKALIEVMSDAVEIVFGEKSRYDDTTFVEGYLENVHELLCTMLMKAENAKTQSGENHTNQEIPKSQQATESKEPCESNCKKTGIAIPLGQVVLIIYNK